MSREEVQKLLGGYATGTLTADEQQALFEAALEDQELFDTLAREQGLRDLLRDPAAKAELLAALDERPARGFWTWLRRPAVAGVAMAGLAAIGVAVWQGSRRPVEVPAASAKPSAAIGAEGFRSRADAPAVARREQEQAQPKSVEDEKRPVVARRKFAAPAAGQVATNKDSSGLIAEPPAVAQAKPAELDLRQQSAQNVAVPAPPPASVNQMNAAQNVTIVATERGAAQPADDARTLFYKQLSVNGRNAFAATEELSKGVAGGGGGAASADKKSAKKKESPAGAAAMLQMAGSLGGAMAAHPGVRCSILRGDREVDLSTPLFAGESVRLRLTPNTTGYLSVYEGEGDAARLVAGGPAQPMKPFETPALKSDAAGQRQLRVTLTLMSGMTKGGLAASDMVSRANLVENTADKESATYVVLRDALPATQQVVVPITLTWR